MSIPQTTWAVMIPQRFADLESDARPYGLPIQFRTTPGSPEWYIPLFDSRKDAVAWNGGADHIMQMSCPEETDA